MCVGGGARSPVHLRFQFTPVLIHRCCAGAPQVENAEEWVLKGIDTLFQQRRVHNLVMEARAGGARRGPTGTAPRASPHCGGAHFAYCAGQVPL